jgi:hypothetical protein
MSRKTFLTIFAGAALSLFVAACDNNDNTNANVNAVNVNAVNVNTNVNANTNANVGSAYNRNYNTREDYNKESTNYRAEAKNKGETVGEDIEDGWIHFKVRGALALVNDLRDSTINVDVEKKVVTLRGNVANADQKAKAEKAAHVDGVTKVVDKLEIKADTGGNKNAGNANAHANANKKG